MLEYSNRHASFLKRFQSFRAKILLEVAEFYLKLGVLFTWFNYYPFTNLLTLAYFVSDIFILL